MKQLAPGGNPIVADAPLRGETAYIYALKRRAQRHHCMGYGTFSVDLTRAEQWRREYSRCVSPITDVPLLVKATALAIERHPQANAILFRQLFGYRIVQFERVDVNLPITRRLGERWITFVGTIRNAARRPLHAIQGELAGFLRATPEECPALARFLQFDLMPLWKARLVHWWMKWSPEFYAGNVGTCGITLAESDGFEHGFPIAPTSVCFGFGGVCREPVVRGDAVAVARVRKCSIMVDNYVVPGLVGAQLMRECKELLESGSFIAEELPAASSRVEECAPEDVFETV